MYFYMNPRRQVFLLQGVILVCVIVLGVMIYNQHTSTQNIQRDLDTLDISCPRCPDSPDVTVNIPSPGHQTKCPEVKCPEVKCPSVKDIVNGVFPGRNTGLTSGGKYFDVKSQGSYELLHDDYSFYKAEDAFPEGSILDPPLRWSNPDVPLNDINNSVDNMLVDSRSDSETRRTQMRKDYSERHAHENASKMHSGADTMGENTSPKMGAMHPMNRTHHSSSSHSPSPHNA